MSTLTDNKVMIEQSSAAEAVLSLAGALNGTLVDADEVVKVAECTAGTTYTAKEKKMSYKNSFC